MNHLYPYQHEKTTSHVSTSFEDFCTSRQFLNQVFKSSQSQGVICFWSLGEFVSGQMKPKEADLFVALSFFILKNQQ